jgi:hypothetical protein
MLARWAGWRCLRALGFVHHYADGALADSVLFDADISAL